MNNAGSMNARLIVILNDNDMSIAPPVGAMRVLIYPDYCQQKHFSLQEHSQSTWQKNFQRVSKIWQPKLMNI